MHKCENCPYIEKIVEDAMAQNARMAAIYDRINLSSVEAQANTIIAEENLDNITDPALKEQVQGIIDSNNEFFSNLPSIVGNTQQAQENIDEFMEARREAIAEYCETGPIEKPRLLGGMVLQCGSSIIDKKQGRKRIS